MVKCLLIIYITLFLAVMLCSLVDIGPLNGALYKVIHMIHKLLFRKNIENRTTGIVLNKCTH